MFRRTWWRGAQILGIESHESHCRGILESWVTTEARRRYFPHCIPHTRDTISVQSGRAWTRWRKLVYALGRESPRSSQTAVRCAEDDSTIQSDCVIAAESAGWVDTGSFGVGDDASLSERGGNSASREFGSTTASACAAAANDGDTATIHALSTTGWPADWAARRSRWTGRE